MNFCIYPAGSWGTAIAVHLSRIGHTVTLVPRTMEDALRLSSERMHERLLPGVQFPHDLQIGMELLPALMEADVCILACPSSYLKESCQLIKRNLGQAKSLKTILTLCKGLEQGTNRLPSDVLKQELPQFKRGVLSGPTFASQVASGQPSAIVLAMDDSADNKDLLQAAMSCDSLRVYTSCDLIGVELGGCLKNVYAIAAGFCDGLGLLDNSKAALLTRALNEMVRVGISLGGKAETFYGLSGFGDLYLTCNGEESRNRTFGELYAKGLTIHELINERKMTVEGYRAAECFHGLCKEKGIDAPILEQIYRISHEGQRLKEAIPALMGRELKAE